MHKTLTYNGFSIMSEE